MNVCAVIPAYQEAAHIAAVVKETKAFCPFVVVVDDGSTDNTAQLAVEAGADNVIKHQKNRGKGVALHTGIDYARQNQFDAVITLDGDGQHAPSDIPAFLSTWERTKVPVLIGNRMANPVGMPWLRRFVNRFMSSLLSHYIRQHVPDTQCGFRLYAKEAFPEASPEEAGRYAAESEVLFQFAKNGIKIGAVPVQSIYGNQISKIRPFYDTFRFFRMIHRKKREMPESH